jgi:peptidoglycan/xylan/chitin deacetylase (PgdA/CDA1 family)
MYHGISAAGEDGVHPYYRLNTSPEAFSGQMGLLRDRGYRAVSFRDAFADPPATCGKPVVITFDDGFSDFEAEAFPVLERHGFKATAFLPTAFIGGGPNGTEAGGRLNWHQVRALAERGMDFGSHTVTHSPIGGLREEELEFEVCRSKQVIEERLGRPIDAFSCPYAFPEGDGACVARLREALGRHGYTYGVSTRIGVARRDDDRFSLKRLPVNSCDDIRFFEAKLEGGYDWLHDFQKLYKRFKRCFGAWPAGQRNCFAP